MWWMFGQGKRLVCGLVCEMEHRVAALRSQLADLGQEHVLAGLESGDGSQRESLVEQLSGIDLPLFRRALADVVRTFKGKQDRYGFPLVMECSFSSFIGRFLYRSPHLQLFLAL